MPEGAGQPEVHVSCGRCGTGRDRTVTPRRTVAAQDICKYVYRIRHDLGSYTTVYHCLSVLACIKTMDETALKKCRSPGTRNDEGVRGDCTDRPPVTSHVTCPELRSAPRGQPRACCHGGRASARARTSNKVTSSVVFGIRERLPGGAHTSPRSQPDASLPYTPGGPVSGPRRTT